MHPADIPARIVRFAMRRPVPVVAAVTALALIGAALALQLRPSGGTDTLVDRDSATFQATERYHQRFGDDAVLVLVKGELTRLVLTADIERLLGLEGCISGNVPRGLKPLGGARSPCAEFARDKPVRVVYGPATFINESVRQIQEQFVTQQSAARAQEKRAATAARQLAAAKGATKAEQAQLAKQAAELVQAKFLRDTLRLALTYGIRSIPKLNDPDFVSQLVFAPERGAGVPKSRFAYLFPNKNSALVQVRLRPDLTDTERNRAIELVRQAVTMKRFAPVNGGKYVVTGAPVVVSDLTSSITRSIVLLLFAALLVMAATLALVFAVRPRLLPLFIALAAVALTFGGMALAGASLTMASVAVVPVLIGLAVDYAIQLQSRYAELREEEGSTPEGAGARTAALGAPTVITAALATCAGFLVLLLSPVPMVRGFGLLLVIGILLALACALLAGFAVLALAGGRGPGLPGALRRPAAALGASVRGAGDLLGSADRRIAGWLAAPRRRVAPLGGKVTSGWRRALREASDRPARVLGIAAAVAALGLVADTQTRVVSDITRLVPQDLGALRDLTELQRATGVSGEIDVTVQAPDLTDPAVLRWMSDYQQSLLRRYGYSPRRPCGQATLCPALSLPDLFRTLGDRPPDRQRAKALLDAVPPYFSQAVITPDRRVATLAFGIRLMPLDEQQRVIEEMRRRLDPPPGVTAELAGLPVLAAEANEKVSSHWRRLLTLLAGLIAVGLVLLAAFREPRRALLPLIPIALASGWSALILFLTRVPLNPMSVTLGALVIAISTEFSVLLAERYRQERAAGHGPEEALARTYRSTGAAVLASGATAIVGFAVLALSDIRMLRDFGLVTVIDLTVSLLGVMIVLPAVLMLAERGELGSLPGTALRRLAAVRPRLRRARAA